MADNSGIVALAATHLSKRFGTRQIVQDGSFAWLAPSVVALTGANGAGKSVLLDMLSGHIGLDHGKLYLCGRDITAWPAFKRSRCGLGYVTQQPMLIGNFAWGQHVRYALRHVLQAGGEAETEQLLALSESIAGIADVNRKLPASALSYGQRKLLGLVCSLVRNPKVLLLDEPFAGLSDRAGNAVVEAIRQARQRALVVFVDHDNDRINGLADQKYRLIAGRLERLDR